MTEMSQQERRNSGRNDCISYDCNECVQSTSMERFKYLCGFVSHNWKSVA